MAHAVVARVNWSGPKRSRPRKRRGSPAQCELACIRANLATISTSQEPVEREWHLGDNVYRRRVGTSEPLYTKTRERQPANR